MARLPGSVQGVVVQITTERSRARATRGSRRPGTSPTPGRGVVVIFDLGLGERGLLDHRPHHRLGALDRGRHSSGTCRSRARSAPRRRSSSWYRDAPSRRSTPRRWNSALCTPIQCAREVAAFLAELEDRHRRPWSVSWRGIPPRSSIRSAGRGSPSPAHRRRRLPSICCARLITSFRILLSAWPIWRLPLA